MGAGRIRRWWGIVMMAALLAGCGSSTATTAPPPAAAATMAPTQAAAGAAQNVEGAEPNGEGAPPAVAQNADPSRQIIKDATFIVEVENVNIALTSIGNTAAQLGGYVLETRTDFSQRSASGAFIKIAVPVGQFEAGLQRVRETALNVLSEQASGTDVSQEFVDTQSRIANLEATQARIRTFLDDATSVEESLQVNAQLSEIESQIGELKGRLQFLSQRAAYSTIAVQLQPPPPPPLVGKPAVLVPVAPRWSASAIARQAWDLLVAIVRVIVTMAIWLAIVVGPFAAPALLIWLWRRRRQRALANPGRSAGQNQP